jgi:hypothetical protein
MKEDVDGFGCYHVSEIVSYRCIHKSDFWTKCSNATQDFLYQWRRLKLVKKSYDGIAELEDSKRVTIREPHSLTLANHAKQNFRAK